MAAELWDVRNVPGTKAVQSLMTLAADEIAVFVSRRRGGPVTGWFSSILHFILYGETKRVSAETNRVSLLSAATSAHSLGTF